MGWKIWHPPTPQMWVFCCPTFFFPIFTSTQRHHWTCSLSAAFSSLPPRATGEIPVSPKPHRTATQLGSAPGPLHCDVPKRDFYAKNFCSYRQEANWLHLSVCKPEELLHLGDAAAKATPQRWAGNEFQIPKSDDFPTKKEVPTLLTEKPAETQLCPCHTAPGITLSCRAVLDWVMTLFRVRLCSAMGLILPGGFRQEKVHEDEKEHVSGLEFSCYAPGNAHQRKYHCLLCTDIELAPWNELCP